MTGKRRISCTKKKAAGLTHKLVKGEKKKKRYEKKRFAREEIRRKSGNFRDSTHKGKFARSRSTDTSLVLAGGGGESCD